MAGSSSTTDGPRRRLLVAAGATAGLVGAGLGAAVLMRRHLPAAEARVSGAMQAELDNAARRAALCTAANATGTGLRGEYFADAGWKGARVESRLDGPVDVDWRTEARAARSARWNGWIKAPLSGAYRFHFSGTRARVVVARQAFDDDGAGTGVHLDAGRFYPIAVEAPDVAPGAALLRLEWTAPHGMRYVVPRPLLFMPTDTVGTTARS